MIELTSEERVLRALRRQEPDRVPHFEWLADRKVRAALCPDCRTFNDFAVRMGPGLEFKMIVWDGKKYREVTAMAPRRKFGVTHWLYKR